VVAALISGTLISTWQAIEATRARNDADRQRVRAQGNLRTALAAVDRMLTRVGEKRLAMVPQMEEERQRLLEDALQLCRELLQEESSDPWVRQEMARAYQRTARIYQLLGKGEQADQAYAQALAIQRDLARQFPDEPDYVYDQGVSHQELGGLLRKLGVDGRAEQSYQQALDLLRPLREKHPGV